MGALETGKGKNDEYWLRSQDSNSLYIETENRQKDA